MPKLKHLKHYDDYEGFEEKNDPTQYFIVRIELKNLFERNKHKVYHDLYDELKEAGFQTHCKEGIYYRELPSGVYAMVALNDLKITEVQDFARTAIETVLLKYYNNIQTKYAFLVCGPSILAHKHLTEIDKSDI